MAKDPKPPPKNVNKLIADAQARIAKAPKKVSPVNQVHTTASLWARIRRRRN